MLAFCMVTKSCIRLQQTQSLICYKNSGEQTFVTEPSQSVFEIMSNWVSSSSRSVLDKSDFLYTPCYCEENVYMLCKQLCRMQVCDQEGADLFVVFISNEKSQVPLWCQTASKRSDQLVVWDYHVICVQVAKGRHTQHLVWDLDTTLPFPVSLYQYINEAIQPSLPLLPEFHRLFRLVHVPFFLHTFASDRRHMRNADGSWKASPPPYDCITATGMCKQMKRIRTKSGWGRFYEFNSNGLMHNLENFITIHKEDACMNIEEAIHDVYHETNGIILDEHNLEEFFRKL